MAPRPTGEHQYTIERLVHYRCTECGGWWSVGDGPVAGIAHCPHCGTHAPLSKEE